MRKDMAKVIVERPRYGSRLPSRKKGYRKSVQSTPIDEQPKHEPMLGRWKGRQRELNEHLGPMRRFLRSNVGRPWNKIHQELCEHISFNNAVQAHVLSHIENYVNKQAMIRGDGVYVRLRWGVGDVRLREGEMYIHPTNGLLCVVAKSKRKPQDRRVVLDSRLQCLRREESWWEVRLRKRPLDPEDEWDIWLERDVAQISESELIREYGGKLYAISKRPLSRQETKQFYRRLRKQR